MCWEGKERERVFWNKVFHMVVAGRSRSLQQCGASSLQSRLLSRRNIFKHGLRESGRMAQTGFEYPKKPNQARSQALHGHIWWRTVCFFPSEWT